MGLEEFGKSLASAWAAFRTEAIDEAVAQQAVKDITNALVRADVDMDLVRTFRLNLNATCNFKDIPCGMDKRTVVQRAIFDGLCTLLDGSSRGQPESQPFVPVKGKQSVILFIGLQGNGKTTTLMKCAHYFKRKGFKPAMVCADTFRAGAFEQLKQNATRVRVPFYGNLQATDPAKVAADGVRTMRAEKRDLILVDSSGRHAQSAELFEEMKEIHARINPDLVVYVMDATTGQSAREQAATFAAAVKIGAIIITKMDGSAAGGSTLSAVAATGCRVMFLGTGEHMDQLEEFHAPAFVSRLLGMRDVAALRSSLENACAAGDENEQKALAAQVKGSGMTLRCYRKMLESVSSKSVLSQVTNILPGRADSQQQEKAHELWNRVSMTIIDSMHDRELDETDIRKLCTPARIKRIAYGSGRHVGEVAAVLEQAYVMAVSNKQLSKAKGMKDAMVHIATPSMAAQLGAPAGGLVRVLRHPGQQGGIPM